MPVTREAWSKPHLEFDVEKEDELHKNLGYKHKIGTTKTKREYEKRVGGSLKWRKMLIKLFYF